MPEMVPVPAAPMSVVGVQPERFWPVSLPLKLVQVTLGTPADAIPPGSATANENDPAASRPQDSQTNRMTHGFPPNCLPGEAECRAPFLSVQRLYRLKYKVILNYSTFIISLTAEDGYWNEAVATGCALLEQRSGRYVGDHALRVLFGRSLVR